MIKKDIIDVDKIPENGIMVIKTDEITDSFMESLKELARDMKPTLSGKNICLLVIKTSDQIETLSPSEMERFGWYKKGKDDISIIIKNSQLIKSLREECKNNNKSKAREELIELIADQICNNIEKIQFSK